MLNKKIPIYNCILPVCDLDSMMSRYKLSCSDIARILKVTRQSVSQWKNMKRDLTAEKWYGINWKGGLRKKLVNWLERNSLDVKSACKDCKHWKPAKSEDFGRCLKIDERFFVAAVWECDLFEEKKEIK